MPIMFTAKTKQGLIRASGIWLLIAGTGLTIWGLFALGAYFTSCGSVNEHGTPATNTVVLIFVPLIIPGLLFLFAGYSLMHRLLWWLAFICLVILCAGALWLGLIGASWLICAPILGISLIAGVFLALARDNCY
jgi:hypothetical protein